MAETEPWLTLDFQLAGSDLISQGGRTGSLIVLREGEVEVLRDGQHVFSTRQPGAIFGEMGLLLERPHTATVRAVTDVQVFIIADALNVLEQHPSWLMQIARLLAQRVNATTAQLVADRGGEADMLVLPSNVFASWSDPQI